MEGSPYSPLKIFHHQDRLRSLVSGEHPVLLHVQLIPTNRCNQSCSFCAYRMHGYSSSEDFVEQDEIPEEKLMEIVDDCNRLNVKAIEITGGGEPTIHPAFVNLCRHIRSHQMEYSVVTNGVRLDREKIHELSHAAWVRFSVDSSNPKTYAAVRKSSEIQFLKTRYNIRELVALRNTQEDSDLIIGVGFVVTRENYKEVVQAAKNAKEDGADNIRISAVFQPEDDTYFKDFYEEARDLCFQAQEVQTDEFRVFNLFGERISDLTAKFPTYSFCGYQYFVTYIGGDQKVYRCCTTAFNPRGYIGDLTKSSFYDVWMDASDTLDDFDARRCPRCMFNSKNEKIAYAISTEPRHVNFL